MIECDDTKWPLAITVAEDAITLADHRRFLYHWSRRLDRAQPFVPLRIFTSDAAMGQPDGALLEWKAWLKINAERIRTNVLGIATAVPYRHTDRSLGTDMTWPDGVAVRVFADGRSAVAWLREEILAPAGMTVDL